MRGTSNEYFEQWEETDFDQRSWEIYVRAKDMEGDNLQNGIDLLKEALEYDPYNDKIKVTIAEKCGKIGWEYLKAKNYIDAQKSFEEAFYT